MAEIRKDEIIQQIVKPVIKLNSILDMAAMRNPENNDNFAGVEQLKTLVEEMGMIDEGLRLNSASAPEQLSKNSIFALRNNSSTEQSKEKIDNSQDSTGPSTSRRM